MSTEEIFAKAIELEPNDREGFLAKACADDLSLRRKVDQLLSAHFEEDSLLGGCAIQTTSAQMSESIGESVGPYKLLQKLGEGGMGIVYMAERLQPVKQRVALKIIKSGMDSKKFVARFEAERQALAMMDHPNISRVFDAGTTDTGRPYFVMELVKGIPITTFCEVNKVSARERIELLREVCNAVQHAHQKGIIHRDLKPSNVLVAMYDDKPVCKVIDFGLAKATNQTLTEKTLFTEVGSILGTWEYMSPEQAVLNQLDVDTRTDVYSLGVMLYELMTGITPLDRERLRRVQLQELLRIIQEEEPPKPSTRLSGTASNTKSLATYRTASAQERARFVRGDLDWITMRALEKDRKRRYESASRLADDLSRFLAGDAIEARPPTWGYRASKLVRRYKLPIAAATLALVGLVASTCIIAGFWLNTRKLASDRQIANDALIQKQEELEQKQDQLVKEKQRVEKSRYLAHMQNAYFAWLDNDVNEVRLLLALYRNSKSIGWEYRHLQQLVKEANYEVFVETPSPLELACSPSEDLLVVSSTTNKSAFTVFRDGRQVGQLGKVARGRWLFHYAQFSDSGNVFLRSSDDFSEIIIHDSATLAVKRKLSLPGALVGKNGGHRFGRSIFAGEGQVLAVAPKLGIVHFDISEPANRVKLLVGDVGVRERSRLAVSPDGRKLFYSAGKRLTVVDLDGEKARVSASVETESDVMDLVILDKHGLLVTASKNGVVALWNASNLSVHRILERFDDEARSLAFRPSKNQLVVGARDRQAVIFDTEELVEVARLRDTNGLYALEFDRDGNLLFGASRGRVCQYRKQQKANQLLPIRGKPVSIDFVDRHRLLVVCEKAGSLLLVDCNSGTVEQIDPGFDGTISAVSTPVGGSVLVVDDLTQAIVSLSLDSGATDRMGTFEGQGEISAIELLAGQVIVGTDTGEVYRVDTSKQEFLFDSGIGMVREIAHSSPDGLYVSNSGGSVCRYEPGGIQRQEFKGDVRALKASKDAIAIGLYHSTHNSGNLFLKVANQLQPIRGHTFSIKDLDLLQDGRTIVTAGADRRLKFWDRDSGEQRISLHLGGVPNALAASPDGTTFALALREGYVQVLRTTD